MRITFKTKILLSSLLILCCICCKTNSSETKILNGIEDRDNKYPNVLQIFTFTGEKKDFTLKEHKSRDWESCSSSVISHNTLLTAAHCIKDAINTEDGTSAIKVRFTSPKDYFDYDNDVNYIEQQLQAKAFYYNKKYTGTTDTNYDIGIVVFEDHSFDGIKPLKISNLAIKEGTKIQLVGYGANLHYEKGHGIMIELSNKIVKYPKYGTAIVTEHKHCPYSKDIEILTVNQNLFENPKDRQDPEGTNSGAWVGDSGGPALLWDNQDLIVGIASYGDPRNPKGLISCYTSINDNLVEWLKHINDTTDAFVPMDEIK